MRSQPIRRVAVLGGGPAGATCAHRLAAAGLTVDLFEARPSSEKPCGGGIPGAALREFPELADPALARRLVTRIVLHAPGGHAAALAPSDPIHIFSRRELDGFLRSRAVAAGATLRETTVRRITRAVAEGAARTAGGAVARRAADGPIRRVVAAATHEAAGERALMGCGGAARATDGGASGASAGGWTIETDAGAFGGYDFLVGADGVRGIVRRSLAPRHPERTMTLARYAYVPGVPREEMVLKFFPASDGYLWVFPRRDHLSIGICATRAVASADRLERDLAAFMQSWCPEAARAAGPIKGYFIPADPAPPSPAPGERWALIGDAGGFVDPITREGIAPAMRSAVALARSLLALRDGGGATADGTAHGTPPLPAGLVLAHRYRRGFFEEEFVERMIWMASGSRAIRRVLGDLFGGRQGYPGLKRRLLLNSIPCGLELGLGAITGRTPPAGGRRNA